MAAETVADGQTELTILLPRRGFAAGWHRLLHDATADEIAAAVGQLAHVNATVVPYQLTGGWLSRGDVSGVAAEPEPARRARPPGSRSADQAADREAAVAGGLRPARRSASRAGAPPRSARPSGVTGSGWPVGSSRSGSSRGPGPPISSASWPTTAGKLLLVFQGRRRIPGIQPGARLVVEGMVGDWARRQAILNPDYELIAGPEADVEPT